MSSSTIYHTLNVTAFKNDIFTLILPTVDAGAALHSEIFTLSPPNTTTWMIPSGNANGFGTVVQSGASTTFTFPAVIHADSTFPIGAASVPATSSSTSATSPSQSSPTESITTTPISISSKSSASPSLTSSISTDSPTSISTKLPAHVTPGAAAGIAIGCLAIGAIIAFLAAFFFFRRSRKSDQNIPAHSGVVSYTDQAHSKQAGTASSISDSTSATSPVLDQLLLAQVSDSDIKKDMTVLTSQIEQHVDNYYHSSSVQDTPKITQALINLGYDESSSNIVPSALAALLADPASRQYALYHTISWTIFDRVSTTNNKAELSLLPVSIAQILRAMPQSGPSSVDRDAYEIALSKWRSTTAFLLHSQRNTRSRLSTDESALRPAISANMSLLQAVLSSFVKATSQTQQETNLKAILVEGAKFGLTLFSQPTKWDFDWTNRGNTKPNIVTFPALVKTTDKNGQRDIGGYSVRKVVVAEEYGNWGSRA